MISARNLIGEHALRRYDEHGEPLLYASERVLLKLRHFDWISRADLYDAMECDSEPTRRAVWYGLSDMVKAGRVEYDGRLYRLAKVQPQAGTDEVKSARQKQAKRAQAAMIRARKARLGLCVQCKEKRAEGHTLCEVHRLAERSRSRQDKQQRRAA